MRNNEEKLRKLQRTVEDKKMCLTLRQSLQETKTSLNKEILAMGT